MDEVDPTHDSLQRHALWGTIMAGGAGVEWYFGAHQEHNDLIAEDLRSRHNLWAQPNIALNFFSQHSQYWEIEPVQEAVSNAAVYAYAKPGNRYIVYLPAGKTTTLSVPDEKRYSLSWFNPIDGGEMRSHGHLLSGPQFTLPFSANR